jgi:hypothetical protein
MWAISSFTLPPGTLLAGTQSNGGYALTFEPALNDQAPVILGTLQVGAQLLALPGTWSGTPKIDFDYQWQRCQTAVGSCLDLSGADGQAYTPVNGDQGKYLRVVVTGSNDFPSFGPINKASSAISSVVGAEPGPLPGDVQQSAPSIGADPPANPSLPEVGDTLHAQNWLFNPLATVSTSFQWLRCDEFGFNCQDIPGANFVTYKLLTADGEHRLRVRVTGRNVFGSATLPDSGPSNTIIPAPATNTSPPTLTGVANVGSSLIGGVGGWASPKTSFERQWELCGADGSSCSPVSGQTSPTYIPTAGDRGMRVRLRVRADVNEPFKLPLAVEVYSPLSDVITDPPSAPGPSPSSGAAPASGQQSAAPSLTPGGRVLPVAPALPAPSLLKLGLKSGAHGPVLSYALSGPGALTIVLQRRTTGRRSGKRCVAGKARGRRCTIYRTVKTIVRRGLPAGAGKLTIPTRGLKAGRYRAIVTPSDAAGRKGAARRLAFKVKRRTRR